MDWLEPIIKWVVLGGLGVFGWFRVSGHLKKDGRVEEKLDQAQEANRAQERQTKAMRKSRARDLLDELKRVRNKRRW